MHAGRLHVVLTHGSESQRTIGDDRERRAVGRVDSVKFLAIDGDGFDVSHVFDANRPELPR